MTKYILLNFALHHPELIEAIARTHELLGGVNFKNLPFPLIQFASQMTLDSDRYLNLNFYPWEFTNISKFKLPKYDIFG